MLRLGAIVVEHNPLYTPRELRHQFEDHGAKVAIAWDKVVATLQDFPTDLAARPRSSSVDMTRGVAAAACGSRCGCRSRRRAEPRADLTTKVAPGTTPWEQLLERRRRSRRIASRPRRVEDVALIQYTSGTTGHPEGRDAHPPQPARPTPRRRAPGCRELERGGESSTRVLPLFHAYGLTLCLTFAMSMGARLVLFPKPDPTLVLPVIKKRPPTFLPAVPPIYERLARGRGGEGVSLRGIRDRHLRRDAALARRSSSRGRRLTGGYLVEGYGLTESSPVLMANPVGADRGGRAPSACRCPSTEVRVVDPDEPDRATSPPASRASCSCAARRCSRGYWNKPDATAAVFADGWFRTGDIVRVDDDGFVTIVDRIKELVITGGFNVSPSEVEDALRGFDGVADVAIVGIPDARDGEHVVAAIVLASRARRVDAEALRAYGREQPHRRTRCPAASSCRRTAASR